MIDSKKLGHAIAELLHGPRTYTKQTIHPKREWLIGLTLFVLIASVGSAWSAFSFSKYATLHMSVTGTVAPLETYKEHTVEKALERYGGKEKKFESNYTPEAPAIEVTQTEPEPIPTEPVANEVVPETTTATPEVSPEEVVPVGEATLSG